MFGCIGVPRDTDRGIIALLFNRLVDFVFAFLGGADLIGLMWNLLFFVYDDRYWMGTTKPLKGLVLFYFLFDVFSLVAG